MAQLYLPVAHTEADLVLAGQIAELIDSAELYVTWTPKHGRAIPEVIAELREERLRWTGTIALVFEAVRELWSLLLSRPPQRSAPAPAVEPAAQPRPAA
jgi:hypothetical protein